MAGDGDLERFDAKATYDDGATDYVQASERFWVHLSDRTVERMSLRPGDRVLDVPCGPGWSALSAAAQVGPSGKVVAFDSSDQMLGLVRGSAKERGLDNVECIAGDMTKLAFGEGSFDAVVSVLGIFFAPDMPKLISDLWRLVRPGGQLAITVLGPRVFDPPFSVFTEVVAAADSNVLVTYPWQRTDRASTLSEVFESAGVLGADVVEEDHRIDLSSAEDFWLCVMGSGMRRTVVELGDKADAVRSRVEDALTARAIEHMDVPAIYGLVRRNA